ncbi:hypothetical protein LDC_0040 [sediment metagenome]|uniref:Gins51 C-terminal domain-containing protein n=1 Tax=sediment metagenome TaxID=749907 RepID=D9PEW2_9ZZZZ
MQPIAKNFISEVSNYLKEKKAIASQEDDGFSDTSIKTKKQLENALTLFKELMLRRRKKILTLVLIAAETGISKQDFENMFKIEKSLFEDLMKSIDISNKELNEALNGKAEEISKNQLVIFHEEMGEVMDVTGEKLGPFEKGQIANIPREIAKILIETGKCEVIEQ